MAKQDKVEEILKIDIKLSLRNLEISFKKRQTNLSFKKFLNSDFKYWFQDFLTLL